MSHFIQKLTKNGHVLKYKTKWIDHFRKKIEHIQHLDLGKVFIELATKSQSIKGKIHTLDLIKITSFCSVKFHMKRKKRSNKQGENVCKTYI